MHDPTGMHVVEGTADLVEVLPDGSFRDQTLLFLKVLRKIKYMRIIKLNNI